MLNITENFIKEYFGIISNIKIYKLLQFAELEINCFRCAYTEERKLFDKKKRLKRN